MARHTLSGLPNDVMSKIHCGELHSVLFGRRHSTLQSHGFLALAIGACSSLPGTRTSDHSQNSTKLCHTVRVNHGNKLP